MASKTLTMTKTWCSGTLSTAQTLSTDKRSATITATLKLWRNDGGESYDYETYTNNFWVSIDGTPTYFSIQSINGSGVTKTASKSVTLNQDGTKNVTVQCGGGLNGTTFQISGTQSLTHTVTGGVAAYYTVRYNANGGTGNMESQTVTYNSSFLTRQNTFTRSGYKFVGWNEKADGSGVPWALTSAGVYEYGVEWTWTYTNNITLYAQWEKITIYTISYNGNGGSGAPGSQTKNHEEELILSPTVPIRDGYEFLGWATSPTATSATYAAGGSYIANSSVTLYAVWKSIKQTIRLYKSGIVQAYQFVEANTDAILLAADGTVTVSGLEETI